MLPPLMELAKESTLHVIGAISENFGIKSNVLPQKNMEQELAKGYKNVVFLILDGLGTSNLNQLLPQGAFLRRHYRQSLVTVYPSTTTSATVSLESGLTPAEHGWLGWAMHMPQEGKTVNLLINTDEQGRGAAPYHVGRKYMPYTPLHQKITNGGLGVGHYVSPFGPGKETTFTLVEMSIKQICNRQGRQYIHAYWPQPDALMHEYGINHPKTMVGMEKLNRRIEALAGRLKDTLLIITADHGLINGKNINLDRETQLWQMLERPPAIEPRCRDFQVKKGMEQSFKKAFEERFGEEFILYTKEEALANGLFGQGEIHPQIKHSLGQFIGVAIGTTCLFDNDEKCRKFIGIHAGYTKEELEVPLIMVPCLP